MKKIFTSCFALLFSLLTFSQTAKFGFDKLLKEKSNEKMPFAIVYEGEKTLSNLLSQNVTPKRISKEWVYVTTTPQMIQSLMDAHLIRDFYFENSRPQLLNDSTRVKAHVEEIQNGLGGLSMPYTGKNVIVGIVDDGCDFKHPDLIDANGKTRVLYYWDHQNANLGVNNVPQPYNYGLEYDSSYINDHIETFGGGSPMYVGLGGADGTGFHGTNVTGIAAGNALANGRNKGMAPDSKIIFVRTDFGLVNWTLSVADACEYIFNKADAMGLPCVINLSLGDYLGSHDGNDPASVAMESFLDEKPGRIIVCAAGNSGNIGNYHVQGIVDADTSFVWFKNNSNGAFGPNTIYLDIWGTQTQMQNVQYAIGANLPNGSFATRATTQYYLSSQGMGGVINDTLRNANGDEIAIMEIYPSIESGAYHLQLFFSKVDSTSYNFSFLTTGNGKYDAWSGSGFGLNDFVSTIPTVGQYPPIANYNMSDSLQSIVSSWACSEKVITVGNYVNRQFYQSYDNQFITNPGVSGKLSVNSSNGPSRLGIVKPDVVAPGDNSFSCAPIWYYSNPANYFKLDQGGLHMRNGGTSMASPCITGIAALYLEKCSKASYQDFKTDLISTGFEDAYTGTTPNFAYGNGKVHGLNLLLEEAYPIAIVGTPALCGSSDELYVNTTQALDSISWTFAGNTSSQDTLTVTTLGLYTVETFNAMMCKERDTLTKTIIGTVLPAPVIDTVGGVLSSSACPNYQWYVNGNLIAGQTAQSWIGVYSNSVQYQVSTTSPEGCVSFSNTIGVNAVDELSSMNVVVYPNPSSGLLTVQLAEQVKELKVLDMTGKLLLAKKDSNEINISSLADGVYVLKVVLDSKIIDLKIEKQ